MGSKTIAINAKDIEPVKTYQTCMVCDKIMKEYDGWMPDLPKLCEDCKKAVLWARKKMEEETPNSCNERMNLYE